MLPISAGSSLILSGKKRAQKRRLEPEPARPPARPRGDSALAGSAGRAVIDPALPAHRPPEPRSGHHRFPLGARQSRGLPASAAQDPKEGLRTSGAQPPASGRRLSAPPGPAATPSSPGKPCGGAACVAQLRDPRG